MKPVLSEDLADERPRVEILDRPRIAALATLLMGLTHTDSDETAARKWCIDEALRQLIAVRARIKAAHL